MDERQARQSVIHAGQRLVREGLVARTWGNVSCKTEEDHFVITPSGLGYDAMTDADLVLFDLASGAWTGARKPSSEKGVHAAAYRRFPDAGFVIHTHQTYASALGFAGFDARALGESACAALGGVALAQYGLPGTKRLSANVAAAMEGGAHTVLMAHHGALLVGRDADEAFARASLLESVCAAACKGQPEASDVPEAGVSSALANCAARAYPYVALSVDSAVVAASEFAFVPAQLDDMAQMIGARLVAVAANERAVTAALEKHAAVLVRGCGALCRAQTEGDADVLRLLTKKACVAFLHTRACGVSSRLSLLDTSLMRLVYQQKYAKKMGG